MSRIVSHLLCALVACGLAPVALSQETVQVSGVTVLRYFQTDARYSFRVRLLEAVMKETEAEYGPFRLEPTEHQVTQARGLQLLETNAGVDIAFIASSREREAYLLAVKEPILSGILGFRVNLIHKAEVEAFKRVTTFDQLRQDYIAGFGSQWADMAILEHNGMRVFGVASYENIFRMLEHQRFHYFPRGINEAWGEITRKGETYPGLVVEESLALYYPYPVYFFVSKASTRLAARLEKGLQRVKSNGTYQPLFLEEHGADIARAKLAQRKLFVLTNPALEDQNLPEGTFWWLSEPIPGLNDTRQLE